MNITFERAATNDAEQIIAARNLSFYHDYIKYGVCPGYNRPYAAMVNAIDENFVYKIMCEGQVIGDISVKDCGEGHYYLSCLCVIPEYENLGIGSLAMKYIDKNFPDATLWTLETPSDKLRNHYFYKKHGFTITCESYDNVVAITHFERKT